MIHHLITDFLHTFFSNVQTLYQATFFMTVWRPPKPTNLFDILYRKLEAHKIRQHIIRHKKLRYEEMNCQAIQWTIAQKHN